MLVGVRNLTGTPLFLEVQKGRDGVLFKVYEQKPPKGVHVHLLRNGKDFGVQNRFSSAYSTIVIPVLNNVSSFISVEELSAWVDTVRNSVRERFVLYTLHLNNTRFRHRFEN